MGSGDGGGSVVCDWDAWRAAYGTMTYAEQQTFHSTIYAQYPVQRHFDEEQCAAAIDAIEPRSVVELGGWDGELAERMLTRYPGIEHWTNVELCSEAATAGRGRHPRYTAVDMDDWYWSRSWEADLFVASHVIEHLTEIDLARVLGATHTQALFLDAPLLDWPMRWDGFTGTHILEASWPRVVTMCEDQGYILAWANDHDTSPESGDRARACLLTRQDVA